MALPFFHDVFQVTSNRFCTFYENSTRKTSQTIKTLKKGWGRDYSTASYDGGTRYNIDFGFAHSVAHFSGSCALGLFALLFIS